MGTPDKVDKPLVPLVPLVPMATRFRAYEDASRGVKRIEAYRPFLVRLDGSNFSAVTKKFFNKPFDDRFCAVMQSTMVDGLNHFRPSTAYVSSDEITLVFPPLCTKTVYEENPKRYTHPYGGRVDKLLSLTAGYISMRFFVNLPPDLQAQMDHVCVFDARLILVPEDDPYELVNHMIWREGDCKRNTISGFGRYILGHKGCHGLSGKAMIEAMDVVCKTAKQPFAWKDVNVYLKRGVYGKGTYLLAHPPDYDADKKAFIQTFEDPLKFLFEK